MNANKNSQAWDPGQLSKVAFLKDLLIAEGVNEAFMKSLRLMKQSSIRELH